MKKGFIDILSKNISSAFETRQVNDMLSNKNTKQLLVESCEFLLIPYQCKYNYMSIKVSSIIV